MERPAPLDITVGGSEEHERGLGPWGWIERRQGDTERAGEGREEQSVGAFDILIFGFCLEGNKGTILQRLLISRALDQWSAALNIINKRLSATLKSLSENLQCPAQEMAGEVTRQTVLYSQVCGNQRQRRGFSLGLALSGVWCSGHSSSARWAAVTFSAV